MALVDELIQDGWLKTPEIIGAFLKIKRQDFLPENLKSSAQLNEALPIGSGQTISQPLTVAFMLELLQPRVGDKILDIGYGSGWTTAILAEIASQNCRNKKGRVVAVEIIPELARFGKINVEKYGFIKTGIVKCILDDGSKGFEKEAPYDKILVSASSQDFSSIENLKDQLKIGGCLVCPIQNSIWLFIKKDEKIFEQKEYPGFVFVPLVSRVKK